MRVIHRAGAVAILAAVAGCAESVPTATEPPRELTRTAAVMDGDVELKRPRVDVTRWVDETITQEPSVFLPGAPEGLGPGTPILITIPGEGRFGCTANFVWRDGTRLLLGAAGHCFLPSVKKSTHGEGADYDASGVTVQACVDGCEGNFRTATLVGKLVNLGRVVYARQTDPTATEDVGNDFGVVEIPAAAAHLVRPEMPVWGPFKGVTSMEFGKTACHYGNGVGVGETFVTKARVGLGGGSDAAMWYGDFAGAFGDSGSGIMGCELSSLTFAGTGAIGVLTHLGVAIGDVKYKGIKTKVEHGFVLGTTVKRAIEMGREAGLSLSIVEP
jgi:hypothetical protein